MNIIRQELKNALTSWGMALCVLGYLGIMVMEVWTDYSLAVPGGSYDVVTLHDYATSVSFVEMIIPIFAALPYGLRFVKEWNSRYADMVFMRVSPSRYCRSKITACAVSGFLGFAIPTILFMVWVYMKFGLLSADTLLRYGMEPGLKSFIQYGPTGACGYLACRVLFSGLFGALCALMSLAVSAFATNAHLALSIPFVTLQFVLHLGGRFNLSDALNILHLARGVISDSTWSAPGIMAYCIIVLSGLTGLCAACFYLGVRRRYQNA